jgi:hypothetical protein
MTIESFNNGRHDPVTLDLDESEIRLRLLELESWARFNHPGFTRLVDSASESHLLSPDDICQLVAEVRAKQTIAITVHKLAAT